MTVLITARTTPSSITSTTFGCPADRRLGIAIAGRPRPLIIAAVPSVAYIVHPAEYSSRIICNESDLSRSAMLSSTGSPGLIERPAAISAFATAGVNSVSIPITSPVDFISGPKYVSTPVSLDIEKTGALTPTSFCRFQSPPL